MKANSQSRAEQAREEQSTPEQWGGDENRADKSKSAKGGAEQLYLGAYGVWDSRGTMGASGNVWERVGVSRSVWECLRAFGHLGASGNV